MTTKIKVLLAVITLELALVGLWWGRQSADNDVIAGTAANTFALADTTGIDKIVLGQNTLQRQGKNWLLNGKYAADMPLLEQLLQLLGQLEVKKPVPAAQRDSVAQGLARKGESLEVSAQGKPRLAFRFAALSPDETAAVQPGQAPVVLYVPGHNLVLHLAFTLSEGDWRNKTIMASHWATLRRLKVSYTERPADDFEIVRSDKFYSVEGLSQIDSAMVYNYVGAYRNVKAYSFIDSAPLRDSLAQARPLATIELEDANEARSNTLKVYASTNRMYGIVGKSGELVALEPRYFTRYLVRRSDFAKENP